MGGFIAGLFIGALIGAFLMGCLIVGGEDD